MAGLVPATQTRRGIKICRCGTMALAFRRVRFWVPGTSPGMTIK